MIASAVFFAPLVLLLFVPGEVRYAVYYIEPGLLLLLSGFALLRLKPAEKDRMGLTEREGSIVVLLAWLAAAAAGAWTMSAVTGLDFTRGFFESVSGWTTTGLSVVDVTTAPKTLLLFRSSVQLAGGAGLAIIMLAAFSLPVGAGIYRAEGRSYLLAPNVTRSAKLVVRLYAGYTVAGTLALWASGMTFFDAVNHAFAAVSTGGFSTHLESDRLSEFFGDRSSDDTAHVSRELQLPHRLGTLTG